MSRYRNLRLAGIAILAAGIFSTAHGVLNTRHEAIICRSDPFVTLSNGIHVRLASAIYEDSHRVSKVTYILTGPRGTSVKSVAYLPSSVREAFRYVAVNRAGTYDSSVIVADAGGNAQVSATTTLSAKGLTVTRNAYGQTGQQLRLAIHV